MVLQTSIKVTKKSKKEWEANKIHSRESMEDMINRIFAYALEREESLDKDDLKDIKLAMKDFENGRFTTNKDLRKELKL